MKNVMLLAAMSSVATSGPVYAQSGSTPGNASGESGALKEEIVVSAQRREQSILEVPVAVSSLSAENLEDNAINDILDLATINPSVSGTTVSNPVTGTDIRIRGIGTTGSNAGFESSVGVYVDDIYYSRPGLAFISFFDMNSVEVYRGPQGTLFGRNISAGAIMQRTTAPALGETAGFASVELAEYNSYDLEAAVNVALGDNSAFRFSGIVDNTDGYIENVTTNDDAAAYTDVWGLRAQYLVQPSDALSVRLVADSSRYGSGRFYQQNDAIGISGRYENTTSFASTAVTEQWGTAGHVEYDIDDTVALKSITSFRKVDSENLDGDFDFSLADIAGDLDETQDMDTFSQEFLVTFDTENAFITTGLHYFNEEIDYQRFNVNLSDAFGGGTFQNVAFLQDEESVGIFAHADFTLSDQFSLIGGMRWSQVDKNVDFRNLLGTPQEVYDNIANDPSLAAFFGSGGGADTAFPYKLTRSFDAVTGDVAIQWRPTDDLQAYLKYSRGFKAGGFNMNEAAAGGRPLPGVDPMDTATVDMLGATDILGNGTLFQRFDPASSAYDEEVIDSYEASLRFQRNRNLVSATAFYSDITDLQVGVFTGLNFETFNAPSAKAYGLELDALFNVTENLSLNAALTLLETEITEELSREELVRGRDFIYAPNRALVIGANYDKAISSSLELNASVNLSYHSAEYTRINGCVDGDGNNAVFDECVAPVDDTVSGPNSNAFFQNDGHSLVNANLGVTIVDNYSVELFCTNCFDTYHTNFNTFTPIANVRSDYPGAPQIWGLRAKANY